MDFVSIIDDWTKVQLQPRKRIVIVRFALEGKRCAIGWSRA